MQQLKFSRRKIAAEQRIDEKKRGLFLLEQPTCESFHRPRLKGVDCRLASSNAHLNLKQKLRSTDNKIIGVEVWIRNNYDGVGKTETNQAQEKEE